MTKDQALAAAGVILLALLAWGGTTLVSVGNDVAALKATQLQLVDQNNRILDALIE